MSDFYTKHGKKITPVSSAVATEMLLRAEKDFSVQIPMFAEAAGFSLSIVIRYALGLSAYEGRTFALVSESLEGCIALSGLRQLVNAGVDAGVILLDGPKQKIPWYEQTLSVLDKQEVPLILLEPVLETEFEGLLTTCHNLIIGFNEESHTSIVPRVCDIINENATPCHCVGLPPGVSRKNQKLEPWALFSSSTLALGVPDELQAKYMENLGRWYVADCSIPKPLYLEHELDPSTFFAEQPVIEIIKKE